LLAALLEQFIYFEELSRWSAMSQKKNEQDRVYRIRLKGILNRSMIAWFGGISILPGEHNETLLVGHFRDQAALRGFLDQLWNPNFTILSVEHIENGIHQDVSHHGG
jgi:hypothetical protein